MIISMWSLLVLCVHYLWKLYRMLMNEKVWLLSKIDLSTRVADSFLLISVIHATRIMSWPAHTCRSIKDIIITICNETWCMWPPLHAIWYHTTTSCCHVINIFTIHWSIFLSDYISTIWLTNNPIINGWLDHELLSNIFPNIPVHGS